MKIDGSAIFDPEPAYQPVADDSAVTVEFPDDWTPTWVTWNFGCVEDAGRDRDGQKIGHQYKPSGKKFAPVLGEAGVDGLEMGSVTFIEEWPFKPGCKHEQAQMWAWVVSGGARLMSVEDDHPAEFAANGLDHLRPNILSGSWRGAHRVAVIPVELVPLACELLTAGKLPGGDLRFAGFIPVPGSAHPDGPGYRWIDGRLNVIDEATIRKLAELRKLGDKLAAERCGGHRGGGGGGAHGGSSAYTNPDIEQCRREGFGEPCEAHAGNPGACSRHPVWRDFIWKMAVSGTERATAREWWREALTATGACSLDEAMFDAEWERCRVKIRRQAKAKKGVNAMRADGVYAKTDGVYTPENDVLPGQSDEFLHREDLLCRNSGDLPATITERNNFYAVYATMSDPPPVIPLPGTPEDRRAPQRRFRGETPEDRYRRRLDTKLRGVQHPDTCHREECAQHAIPDDGVSRDFYQTAIWRLAAGTLSEPDDPWHDRADPDGAARQVVSSDQYPLLAEHEGKVRALADYKPERKPKAKFPGWTGPEPETSGLVPLSRERVQEMALTFCTGDAARVTAEAFAEKFNSEIAPGLHCRPISVKTAELAIAEVKNTGRMFIDSPQGWHRHGQAWVYLPPKYGVIPDEVMGWVESLAASRAAGR